MDCPQCQSDQIDADGVCPACGYRTPASDPAPVLDSDDAESHTENGMIEMDYAEKEQDSEPGIRKPQWRKELSERLKAIRQKREGLEAQKPPGTAMKDAVVSSSSAYPIQRPAIAPAKFLEGPPPRKSAPKPLTPVPRQKTLEPLPKEAAAGRSVSRPIDSRDIQSLIDNAVSRKPSPAVSQEDPDVIYNAPESEFPENEGKLILLSRTLCGLVDLIIVLLCTGIVILAADFVSGIIALDAVSYLFFSFLFLLTYLFYSLFFLTASNQTIGMMITDLRVVGIYHERPSFRQLSHRCGAYLVSLLGLGFGLIWGLFDRESLCFHDRVSDTQVIRL